MIFQTSGTSGYITSPIVSGSGLTTTLQHTAFQYLNSNYPWPIRTAEDITYLRCMKRLGNIDVKNNCMIIA